jgi:hypothetical protein
MSDDVTSSPISSAIKAAQILIISGKREEAVALLAKAMEGEVEIESGDDHIAVGVIASLVASKKAYEQSNDVLSKIAESLGQINRDKRKISDEKKLIDVLEEIENLKSKNLSK